MTHLLIVFLLMSTTFVASAEAQSAGARLLVQQALEAQGGKSKLRDLRTVQWVAHGYRNMLEESERPEGPYIPEFTTISEADDLSNMRSRVETDVTIYPVVKSTSISVVNGLLAMRVIGGRQLAGTPEQVLINRETVALSPERVLLTAAAAADLHLEPDMILQSVPQRVLAFSLDGAPVRVILNSYTHLPTAIDYSGPLAKTGFWKYMGDVTMRTYYSFWWLAKGGIHLPMQWNVEENGLPDRVFMIEKLQLNEPVDESTFDIPEAVRAHFDSEARTNSENGAVGDPKKPAYLLAPGILFIPGAWNTTIVEQNDGLVILEAPISSAYSKQVIAETRSRFPGQRVKAVVTTSDSWPHIAGIREYAAQGIPIYALDLNRPILKRFIEASHTTSPDSLQRAPRAADIHLVADKISLGTGPNRMELYPIRGETSERQMMVYFPEHKLLYGSDAFQMMNGEFFFPQEVTELIAATEHNHLVINTFFMMHVDPTPWSQLKEAVLAADREDTPDGILK